MGSSLSTTRAFSREDGLRQNTGRCVLLIELFGTTLPLPGRSSKRWIRWCSSAKGNAAIHDHAGKGGQTTRRPLSAHFWCGSGEGVSGWHSDSACQQYCPQVVKDKFLTHFYKC